MGSNALLSSGPTLGSCPVSLPSMLCPSSPALIHGIACCQENPPKDKTVPKVKGRRLLVFRPFSRGSFLSTLRPRPPGWLTVPKHRQAIQGPCLHGGRPSPLTQPLSPLDEVTFYFQRPSPKGSASSGAFQTLGWKCSSLKTIRPLPITGSPTMKL